MKYFTTLLFVISSLYLSAQPTLEHTYPFEAYRHQISGTERYVRLPYLDTGVWKTEVYDAAHQLLLTIPVALPETEQDVKFIEGSTDFFDNDPGIEIVIEHEPEGGNRTYTVFDDNGSPLSNNFEYFKPDLFKLSNGQRKMVVADSVFAIPGFNKDYVFPAGEQFVRLANLEQLGDKYYSLNSSGLVLYNLDYTVFKTIPVGVNTATNIYTPSVLGQYKVNGDDAIEFGLFSFENNQMVSRFYSEGTLLSENTLAAGLFNAFQTGIVPADWPGLNTAKSVLLKSNTTNPKIKVTNMLDGAVEFERDGEWRYGNSIGEGIKYWTAFPIISATDTTISVYNGDYSLWAKRAWNPSDYRLQGAFAGIFDTDPATKELLVERASGASSSFLIYGETGAATFTSAQCFFCRRGVLSRVVNAPNKFMAIGTNKTLVYNLPSNGPISSTVGHILPTLSIKALPNPFVDQVQLDLSQISANDKIDIFVFNSYGGMVHQTHQIQAGTTYTLGGMSNMPSGIYWVRVESENGTYGWTKIVKQ